MLFCISNLVVNLLTTLYISGGFAHVYVVHSTQPINGEHQHVLKRVAVPSKDQLKDVRREVDIMVRLQFFQ
jgi:hypothetical protein